MLNENLELINDALKEQNPEECVNNVCKRILKKMLKTVTDYDANIYGAIQEFIKVLKFPVRYKNLEEEYQTVGTNTNIIKIACGIIFALGLLLASSDKTSVSTCGKVMVSATVGFGIGQWLEKKKENTKKSVKYKNVITTTPNELLEQVEMYFSFFSVLLSAKQIETKYIELLRWIQFDWTEKKVSGAEEYCENLSKLLKCYGYAFVEYSENTQHFYTSDSVDIDEIRIAEYALINIHTNEPVIKGHVLCPKG